MDPNANLEEQRQIIKRQLNGRAKKEDFWRLVELVEALDNWISAGGFLPADWQKSR